MVWDINRAQPEATVWVPEFRPLSWLSLLSYFNKMGAPVTSFSELSPLYSRLIFGAKQWPQRGKIWCQVKSHRKILQTYLSPNRHTVPCIPNRYGKRGGCAGLSPSPTPSTRRSISHWWARWVPVACLGHVLRGGRAGRGVGGWAGGRAWEA